MFGKRFVFAVLAMVFCLAIGGVASAQAPMNLDVPVVRTYAAELQMLSAGPSLVLSDANAAFLGQLDFAFAIPASTTLYNGSDWRLIAALSTNARFNSAMGMGNAEFGATPIDTGTVELDGTLGTFQVRGNFGGGTFSSLEAADVVTVNVPAVRVTDKSPVTVTVTLQAKNPAATAWVNKYASTNNYVQHMAAFTTTFTPNAAVDAIDVAQGRLFFNGAAGDNVVQMGQMAYDMNNNYQNGGATAPFDEVSVAATAGAISTVGLTVNAAGSFDAFAQTGGNLALDDTGCANTGVARLAYNTLTNNNTVATWNASAAVYNHLKVGTGGLTGGYLCGWIPAANTMIIPETTVSATLAANMTSTNWGPPADAQTGDLSPLANNGVNARLTFVNSGNSGTPFLVRLTNQGGLNGRVTIDVWQEDGTVAPNSPVDLANVTLLTGALVSGDLAANSSVIFSAGALATAAGLTSSDMMRIRAVGEFTGAIVVQGWSNSNPTTGASFGQTLN